MAFQMQSTARVSGLSLDAAAAAARAASERIECWFSVDFLIGIAACEMCLEDRLILF